MGNEMKKMYVITIQDCSSSMCITGFMYVCAVSSKKKAEKITAQINEWLKHIAEVMSEPDHIRFDKELLRSRLKHNEPPDIGVKWNYEELSRFCYRDCVCVVDEVQGI